MAAACAGVSDGLDFSSATAAADVYPGMGDDRYRAGDYRLREIGRRVAYQLRAHPGDWREGAAMEGWLMSSVANWSYTATATIWRRIRDADGSDTDGGGQPYGWEAPIAILCDYQGGLSAKIGDLGREIVVKNTIWTESATAREGDYILIGASTDAAPPDEADEIRQIVQFADTFERLADDFAIITQV